MTVDTWASLSDASAKGGKGVPRVVGVFFLDRYADGFDLALKAAESAAQSAHASKGGSGAFVWVDAPCQEGFAKALGVSDLSVRCCILCCNASVVDFAITYSLWFSRWISRPGKHTNTQLDRGNEALTYRKICTTNELSWCRATPNCWLLAV